MHKKVAVNGDLARSKWCQIVLAIFLGVSDRLIQDVTRCVIADVKIDQPVCVGSPVGFHAAIRFVGVVNREPNRD